MKALSGPISDRLRKIFSPSDKAWTPQRPPESIPMPKQGVQGISFGRKSKKS
jgi:hypothetical protein